MLRTGVVLLGVMVIVATLASKVNAADVKLGIDVLRADGFKALQGKRIGLVAHAASVDSNLVPTIDVLRAAPGVELVALFGPEHGVWGDEYAGDRIPDRKDPKTGLPVYSLYGQNRKPSPQVLRELDALVFDLQDIGSRSYTYITTMKNCLEACAENAVELIILDRPNPLGGQRIEGPPLREGFESGIGALFVPYVHGMTMGELAQHTRDHIAPGYRKLTVITMQGWKRDMVWEETGLGWVPTSPHIPQVSSCAAYAATGILGELHAVSIGVGYTLPFEIVGSPQVDGDALAEALNRHYDQSGSPPALFFRSARFKPFYNVLQGEPCQGVQVHLHAKRAPTLVEVNFRLIEALGGASVLERSVKRHGSFDKACGSDEPRMWIMQGKPLDELFAQWREYCDEFRNERGKWLLY